MAKNVFRAYEFIPKEGIVQIKSSQKLPEPEPEELAEEYTGPTADELRREAEAFKAHWEEEKAQLRAEAEAEASAILKEAEETAFQKVKEESAQAAQIRIEAEKERDRILEDAKKAVDRLEAQTKTNLASWEAQARKEGFQKGFDEGYGEGKAEVTRLIERIHTITQRLIEKRSDVIEGAETQVIQLVLLIAQKVVKVISENQRSVVINNVLQALRKLRTRGDVVIRVNLNDLKLTSDNVKDFLRQVENVKSISVVEDSTIEPGGCLIETDFGQIDARISSQLREIEDKVRELMPIQVSTPEGSKA